jgi:antitoxin FitA
MKMIKIRNVPDELHRSLEARAAREGTTMSDLILAELPRLANKPAPEEILERVHRRTPVPGASAAELIRSDRPDR